MGSCLQHNRGEENARVSVFAILDSTMDGVCVWVRTDNPATPLPKTINCLNHQQSFLMKVVGIKQGKKTHGYFPSMAQGLTISPTPLSL